VVRDDGSAGRNNGRSTPTRSFSEVIDRSRPIRSAITVAVIVGHSFNSTWIYRIHRATSTGPPIDRGSSVASAMRTVFRAIPNFRTIAFVRHPSARRNRRISGQSSKFSTPHAQGERSKFSVTTGQLFTRR
jgi:hypothetical protein